MQLQRVGEPLTMIETPVPKVNVGERSLRSVANLTRADGREFMEIAAAASVKTLTTSFPLASANEALEALRSGALEGAAALVP